MSSLLNLVFYPFLFSSSNGLFQMMAGILTVTLVFKIVWNIVRLNYDIT